MRVLPDSIPGSQTSQEQDPSMGICIQDYMQASVFGLSFFLSSIEVCPALNLDSFGMYKWMSPSNINLFTLVTAFLGHRVSAKRKLFECKGSCTNSSPAVRGNVLTLTVCLPRSFTNHEAGIGSLPGGLAAEGSSECAFQLEGSTSPQALPFCLWIWLTSPWMLTVGSILSPYQVLGRLCTLPL